MNQIIFNINFFKYNTWLLFVLIPEVSIVKLFLVGRVHAKPIHKHRHKHDVTVLFMALQQEKINHI